MRKILCLFCAGLLAFSCSKEIEQQVESEATNSDLSRQAVAITSLITVGYIAYTPNSVCVDKYGNCYYFDYGHPQTPNALSKVDANTSTIVTLFTLPGNTQSLGVNSNGWVFASLNDYNSNDSRIVRFDPDSGYAMARDYSSAIKVLTRWSSYWV
ncbi:MAG: hypothetical protein LBG19_05690 [Prevotellaceae bacterium]|nr:hypothetical protein [Prevotellaceae bacterium]